jgi:hypothetical protein
MTREPFQGALASAGASAEEARLLVEETRTIDQLVRARFLTEGAGRRQVIKLARRIGGGRR